MRVLCVSLGSRGDVEPFLAYGQERQVAGDTVGFCFSSQFRSLAEAVSPCFFAQSAEFLALLDDPDVRALIAGEGSHCRRAVGALRVLRRSSALQRALAEDQAAAIDAFAPDEVVFHIKCVAPVWWHLNTGGSVRLLAPVPWVLHPVDTEPASGFGSPGRRCWNRLTYAMARAAAASAIVSFGTPLRKRGWTLRASRVRRWLLEELPVDVAVSPALFVRPPSWPSQARVTGFRERLRLSVPNAEFEEFLASHPRPVYVGFGSMVNPRPAEVARWFIDAGSSLGLPLVLNVSWGGLEPPKPPPPNVFVAEEVDFARLLPRVRGVVHHGGSGTTQNAFALGVRQWLVPHLADQHQWARLLAQRCNGPPAVPMNRLDANAVLKGLQALA